MFKVNEDFHFNHAFFSAVKVHFAKEVLSVIDRLRGLYLYCPVFDERLDRNVYVLRKCEFPDSMLLDNILAVSLQDPMESGEEIPDIRQLCNSQLTDKVVHRFLRSHTDVSIRDFENYSSLADPMGMVLANLDAWINTTCKCDLLHPLFDPIRLSDLKSWVNGEASPICNFVFPHEEAKTGCEV